MKIQHVFRLMVAVVVLVGALNVPTAGDAEDVTKAKVVPIEAVVKALMDVGATDLQKQELVGKTYEGLLEVNDVKSEGEGKDKKIRIIVDLGLTGTGNWGYMELYTKDREKAIQSRKGDHIKITGRLTQIDFKKRSGEWATFEDVTIHEVTTPNKNGSEN